MSCNCQEVAERGKLEVEKSLTIPFVAHESEMTRLEKIIKRQWIALIVSLFSFLLQNYFFSCVCVFLSKPPL